MLHLSAVAGSPLFDSGGVRLGRVGDLVVGLGAGDEPPRFRGLKARIGGRDLFVPASRIASLKPSAVRTSTTKLNLAQFRRRPGEALLRADVLGRSLIDVDAARLVRAREIELTFEEGSWRVAGIDPGLGARLRRVVPRRWRAGTGRPGRFVPWSRLEPFVGHVPGSRLRLGARRLARLHPAQLADLVEAASHDEGEEILHAVEREGDLEAEVFEELDDEHRVEFLRGRSDAEVASLLCELSSNDAADLLMQLDQPRRLPVLNQMPAAQRERVRGLLSYNPQTAGGIMNPEFVSVPGGATVAEAIRKVVGARLPAKEAQAVYVSDGGRLTGALPVVDLLRAPPEEAVSALLESDPPAVPATADVPEIACVMSDYDLLSLPVVDDDGRMIGVISLDDIVARILPEGWRRRRRPARE